MFCLNNIFVYSPKAAAVQCAIINPEFRPPSGVKNAGSSLYAKIKYLCHYEINKSMNMKVIDDLIMYYFAKYGTSNK